MSLYKVELSGLHNMLIVYRIPSLCFRLMHVRHGVATDLLQVRIVS